MDRSLQSLPLELIQIVVLSQKAGILLGLRESSFQLEMNRFRIKVKLVFDLKQSRQLKGNNSYSRLPELAELLLSLFCHVPLQQKAH